MQYLKCCIITVVKNLIISLTLQGKVRGIYGSLASICTTKRSYGQAKVIMKHVYNGYYQIWSCSSGMHITVDIVVPVVVVLHYYLVLCVYGLPEAIPVSTLHQVLITWFSSQLPSFLKLFLYENFVSMKLK